MYLNLNGKKEGKTLRLEWRLVRKKIIKLMFFGE
jgi:hypothetical protein